MLDDYPFALCLTHDIDRPFKTYQSLYYAVRDRSWDHLTDVLFRRNPYWQFDEIMALEQDIGVRSAFYVLNEPHLLAKGLRAWLNPDDWIQHLGRYDVENPSLVSVIQQLDAGGWEIGLHGSFRSSTDLARLRQEKSMLEDYLETPIVGGRQHYLKIAIPETWQYHQEIGLRYDASLGSARTYGFQHGYDPLRPFDDAFVVFPLTLMEQTLPDPDSSFDDAWGVCDDLLKEAAANAAVMNVLWHPRFFSESDFPGFRRLYRRLVERAVDMGAWVGPPARYYHELDLNRDCVRGFSQVTSKLRNNTTTTRGKHGITISS